MTTKQQAKADALATARRRLAEEQQAIAQTVPGGFDHAVAEREREHYASLVKTLTKTDTSPTARASRWEREAKAVYSLMAIADRLAVLTDWQKTVSRKVRTAGATWTDVAELQRMFNELEEAERLATQFIPTYAVYDKQGRKVRVTVPPSNNE